MLAPLVAVALISAGPTAEPAGATPSSSLPHVTVIVDSVFTAVQANPEPLMILKQGFDLTLDVGICRHLDGESCPYGATPVPTVLDVVHSLGKAIGPTVVVEAGYHDFADTFPRDVEAMITALVDAGTTHIIWPNVSERRPQYGVVNHVLVDAAARHAQLTVVDWNAYSRDHAAWFQPDDVHLEYAGAIGIATLLHTSLEALLPPLVTEPARLAVGHVGRPYSCRLVASGGSPPYHWRLTSSRLPRGLRLLDDGRLAGTPRRPAHVRSRFAATDVRGTTATVVATIDVLRSSPSPQ